MIIFLDEYMIKDELGQKRPIRFSKINVEDLYFSIEEGQHLIELQDTNKETHGFLTGDVENINLLKKAIIEEKTLEITTELRIGYRVEHLVEIKEYKK